MSELMQSSQPCAENERNIRQKLIELEKKLESSQLLLYEVEKTALIGSWEYDLANETLHWSDETYRIYGLPIGSTITPEIGINFYSPEAQRIISLAFEDAIKHQKTYELELPFLDNNGKAKWIKTSGRLRLTDGQVSHVYGVFEDISYQKELQDINQQTNANFKKIVDNLNDAIVTISETGKILSTNSVVHKVFGYQSEELVGKDISMLMPEPFASKHQIYMNKYLATGRAGIIGVGRELPALKKDGTQFSMELSISEVLHRNQKVFIGIVRDISERKASENHIKRLAYYDELTGALNRTSFEKDLDSCIQSGKSAFNNWSILLTNIDKFSQINLIYSEKIADILLKEFVSRVSEHMPPCGTIYRNNADSFFVILKNSEAHSIDAILLQEPRHVAEQILEDLNRQFHIEGHEIAISVSIGMLDSTKHTLEKEEVKPLLELAVRNAKLKGGNQWSYAESKEMAYLKRHSQLTIEMQKPKFVNELFLVVQPQFDTKGKMVGSEALIRWRSQELGFISPAEFIPLAENNGKILDVGNWVIDKVCTLLAQRRLFSESNNPISINVSAKQIAQPSFADSLISKLAKYNIPHSEVILELTESTLVADFNLVISKMRYLKERGIHFSLDDFGTGYSSLSYIQSLPISELKIDKAFIDEIQNEHQEVPIVNSIIQMAKALDLKIVAEGVETSEQLAYLNKKGCEVIQGYLFSKPLNIEHWLETACRPQS